jgi:hypothetical protein
MFQMQGVHPSASMEIRKYDTSPQEYISTCSFRMIANILVQVRMHLYTVKDNHMHKRSLGSKADPAFWDKVHGAHRQQQTVEVVATGTFLIRRDSTGYSYNITQTGSVLNIWQCCHHRRLLRRHRTALLTAMNPIRHNILWI